MRPVVNIFKDKPVAKLYFCSSMPFKKIVFFCLLSTIFGSLKASKIETAFEALRIYDYFKAKKLFYSELNKKHKAAAAYGLATIYYRHDNPFHHSDSASKFITLSGNYLKQTKLSEIIAGYTIDSLNIQILADSVSNLAYSKAALKGDISSLEQFLLSNPYASAKLKSGVLYMRDELYYKLNLGHNSSDSTKQYLIRFPESFFLNDYLFLLDKQIFEEQTLTKKATQLISFLKRFTSNRFAEEAKDELFQIYSKNRKQEELDFYVRNFPKSHFINEAWKLLYSLTVKSYNTTELQSFISRYPDFPFKASINKEIELNTKILIPAIDGDFTGFIDTTGKFGILPVYDAVTDFKEGLSVVTKNDSSFFINKENENVFSTFYTEAYPFINGNAAVNIKGQWFLINRQGQKVAGPFEDLSEQSEHSYIVKQNSKYGAIDSYGNYIYQPQFDKMGDFKNGFAYYMNNGLYGFVRRSGTHSQAKYQWISDFDENKLALIKMNNLFGLINMNDSLVLAPSFELLVKAKNNNFIVVKNGKYGFFSGMGCLMSEVDFDYRKELNADYYTNGKLYKLLKKQKQALMDANGKISIDFGTYEEVHFAQNNLIRIKKKNKYGFVDRRLNIVIPCKYNTATDFNDSISICTLKQETIIINTKGEELFRTKGSIEPIAPGYLWVKEEESNKLISKGKLLFSGLESWQKSPDGYLILDFENKSKKVLKL
jgi:hypothetical protein